MGWWRQSEAGDSLLTESITEEEGELVWGDAPADVIDNALAAIDEAFLEAWDRQPTVAELRAGFEFSVRIRDE